MHLSWQTWRQTGSVHLGGSCEPGKHLCRPCQWEQLYAISLPCPRLKPFAGHISQWPLLKFLHVTGWDQKSLEAYLLRQMPNDEKCRALLTSCAPSLWKLVTYFSQWPFTSTTSGSTSTLSFHALVRAIAFLSGRHSIMFAHFNEKKDADVPRRKDRLVLEHMFRALAIDAGQETTTTASSSSSHSLRDDVLDTLNTVQPVLNEFTVPVNRDRMVPLAVRLLYSPGDATAPAALSSLTVPTAGPSGILALLDLFVSLLQHATKFDTTGTPVILIKDLETAHMELQKADSVSFDAFIRWLGHDNDLNVYDAVALLFTTFPNPKSLTDGIMINHFSEDEVTLLLCSLRRPGLTLVSS